MSCDLTKSIGSNVTTFMVCHHLSKFVGHRYCSSRDMFLVCHAIKQDHVIKRAGDYSDNLPSLVVIGNVVVEIQWF